MIRKCVCGHIHACRFAVLPKRYESSYVSLAVRIMTEKRDAMSIGGLVREIRLLKPTSKVSRAAVETTLLRHVKRRNAAIEKLGPGIYGLKTPVESLSKSKAQEE